MRGIVSLVLFFLCSTLLASPSDYKLALDLWNKLLKQAPSNLETVLKVSELKFLVEGREPAEKILLEVWTDGSIKADEALIQSATIIKNHMGVIIPSEKEPEFVPEEKFDKDRERMRELLQMDIEELELSNRALNCLKKGRSKRTGERVSIKKVADLVRRTEKEMLNIENFGRKSLDELKKVLEGI